MVVPKNRDNWQQSMKDTASTIKHLFDLNIPSLSDVSFKLDNEAGKPVVFHVHKFILACRSSVFEAMFYGPMAEAKMPIAISDPNMKAETFRTMLQYIYKDDVTCVHGQNVLPLLYVAHKYGIGLLIELCSKTAAQGINADNVFQCIQQAGLYDAETLLNACYEFIDKHTTDLLCRPEFLLQPRNVVNDILKRSSLGLDGMPEICIFKAVSRKTKTFAISKSVLYEVVVKIVTLCVCGWALAEADRLKIPAKPTRIREALDKTVYLIRFPLMAPVDIVQARKDSILTAEETADLLAFLHKVEVDTKPFTKEPRSVNAHVNPNRNW
ncbi:putative BTB/POZ domain-containing protein 2 [Hypsibius exemplaris]|uniref:BTB/POZ domain-containing protein 2 n=1 Tax=Hypsibius exemplaris TaxID=2072580 RepID=A0A9X6NBB2_HYPEX|nr:putative BTB/POZ domain-containing protein 2 [Hypsibius exemplaris]